MQIIDLSPIIYTGMPVYPGDPEVVIKLLHDYSSHSWQLRQLQMGSHTAAHVDVFSHMDEAGANLEQLPLSRFLGPAQAVTLAAIYPQGMGLIFRDEVDLDQLPAILAAGAPFVAGEITLELERALLKQQIITYTGLINLDQLPIGQTIFFIGLPLRIAEGDGSPVRAIAILDATGLSLGEMFLH